jgi:(E)-4-hydroxy-3-methylbut-2-enyl-diphosphate synthase
VEKAVQRISKPITIALMGCVVNGPGEAKEADIGIAGGKGVGLLFKKGRVVRKVKEKDFANVLLSEIYEMTG